MILKIANDNRSIIKKGVYLFSLVDYPKIQDWEWNSKVVDFIFSETTLDRLEGHADVRNAGSNRVLQKSGFQLEGTIRHGKMVSQYCDYNIWGMIREDFRGEVQ